jgi:hypothetical protein
MFALKGGIDHKDPLLTPALSRNYDASVDSAAACSAVTFHYLISMTLQESRDIARVASSVYDYSAQVRKSSPTSHQQHPYD